MDMKTHEEVLKEVLETKDPRESMIKIVTGCKENGLPAAYIVDLVEEYKKKHGVTSIEMSFYPNGERVVAPEIFQ